jgi:hypothetical protein
MKPFNHEEFEAAWERHRHYSGREPQRLVIQMIISGGDEFFPLKRFRDRHAGYCDYYDNHAKGWEAYGVLTFLGWIEAGMPEPPEPRSRAQIDRDAENRRIAEFNRRQGW